MVDVVGWLSSLILLATIVAQVRKLWQERTARGVSKWLFAGQATASLGFTVYSLLVRNWVFTITNALLFVSALVGCFVSFRYAGQRQQPAEAPSHPG